MFKSVCQTLPVWLGGVCLVSLPLTAPAQDLPLWNQLEAPYTKASLRARQEQEQAAAAAARAAEAAEQARQQAQEQAQEQTESSPSDRQSGVQEPSVQEPSVQEPSELERSEQGASERPGFHPPEAFLPTPPPAESTPAHPHEPIGAGVDEPLMFEGADDCTSFWTDCNSCCFEVAPTMLGDGGLLQPRLLSVGTNRFAMQNHMSKVAENNPVRPTTRFAFQYNALQQVPIGLRDNAVVDEDVHEFRVGFEKSFWDGRFSAELLLPFYQTSEYQIEGAGEFALGPQMTGQMGDLAFGFKGLLHQGSRHAISAGVRMEAPTHEDVLVDNLPAQITDDVWHFTPYVAAQWNPQPLTFTQAFVSYRLNDRAMISQAPGGPILIDEAEYLMVDAAIGRWLIRNPDARILTGLAPVLELHYTTSTTREPGVLAAGRPATGAVLGSTDYLNLTAAVVTEWYGRATLTSGFAFPLRNTDSTRADLYPFDTDRNYNWAFMVNLNVPFGP